MNIIGSEINGYYVIEALGSGSFGSVYKVSKDNNIFAAKILSETYIIEEFKKGDNRVTRELSVLKRVNGENLIKYIDDFFYLNEFSKKEYVIIMEFFQGKALSEIIYSDIDINKRLEIFKQILIGVNQLHSTDNSGIIHRDLKPDNILINSENKVKIIDYGLSKIIDFSSLTSTGAFIGSPLYMSPEQVVDSKKVDFRSDVYSLGVILYELVTKTLPYSASTVPELLMKIINEPIIPPTLFDNSISNNIEKVIYKSTSKDVYSRYKNITEFINDFDNKENLTDIQYKGTYFAWVYKEKKVTQEFLDLHKDAEIIYPIHVKNWQKNLHNILEKRNFEHVIIDPSTQRLSYIAFGKTKGLIELPYSPQNGVISLDYLNNPENRRTYISKWSEIIKECKQIILPYHYISNTDYSIDKIEEWIKINIQLINEASNVVNKKLKKYAMISIGLSHLVYSSKEILKYYVSLDVEGFIVQVSDMKQLNEQSLKSYIDFVIDLQKYSLKPVIALKVPISIGLTLVALGLKGFSLGLASIDYFDEAYIKEEKDSFNLYCKYYFPELLSFYTYPRKEQFDFQKIYEYFGGCKCHWCCGKDAIEIATGDRNIQLHHWEKMLEEVEKINSISEHDRKKYIKSRIGNSILNYNNIPKEISRSLKSTEYYKLLVILEKIL